MLDVARREKTTHFIKYVDIPNQETALETQRTFGIQYWRILPVLGIHCRSELVQQSTILPAPRLLLLSTVIVFLRLRVLD